MAWAGFILGAIGSTACLFFPQRMDQALHRLGVLTRKLVSHLTIKPKHNTDDLTLITTLMGALRAGISLDAALANLASPSSELSEFNQARIRMILAHRAQGDFLSCFLQEAVESGTPLLEGLNALKKALAQRWRLQLKAHAATSQSRAQAEVLSWLPIILVGAVALVDFELLEQAANKPIAWILWSAALALTGLGCKWIKSSLSKALHPGSIQGRMEEEELPEFVLRLLAAFSLGRDVESAIEESLRDQARPGFSEVFHANLSQKTSEKISALRFLLTQARLTGAPVRVDLLNYLSDLQTEIEARWEERVQRLPVVMMAPLFLCFFPSTLLALAGLIMPLFEGLQ